MAVTTYDQIIGALSLFAPTAPYFLLQQMVQNRYRQILQMRDWSGLRAESQFLINQRKLDGTVNLTRNSTTVTGVGTTFASSDVGRQFKGSAVHGGVYTISSVDVGLQTLVIDRVWGGPNSTGTTYIIFDGYVTAPTDFQRFIDILVPSRSWRLRKGILLEELNRWDPQRTWFGDPYTAVDRRFSGTTPQYELWPFPTADLVLPFYYIKKGTDLSSPDNTPIPPITGDLILKGTLVDLALWPGTAKSPNPMSEKWRVDEYRGEYTDLLTDIERRDEEIYLTWYQDQQWYDWPFAPLSANWMQSHAI